MPVIAFGGEQEPTVSLKQLNDLSDLITFHSDCLLSFVCTKVVIFLLFSKFLSNFFQKKSPGSFTATRGA